jgi:hypothetical protein
MTNDKLLKLETKCRKLQYNVLKFERLAFRYFVEREEAKAVISYLKQRIELLPVHHRKSTLKWLQKFNENSIWMEKEASK